MNCNDPKYNCGQLIPSSCVPLQTNLEFVSFKKSDLSCDPTITEVIHKIDSVIKVLQDSVNLTNLDKKSLIFDKNTVDVKTLFQLLISLFDELRTDVTELENKVNGGTLLTEKVKIDLSCLGSNACTPSSEYTIVEILTTLVNAYCNLKTSIDNL